MLIESRENLRERELVDYTIQYEFVGLSKRLREREQEREIREIERD